MEEKKHSEQENGYQTRTDAQTQSEGRKESDREHKETASMDKKTSDEMVQNTIHWALGYQFGILFFLPLVCYPNDEFAKFHANQALVVLLTVVIGEVIFGILNVIPVVGFVFAILCGLFGLLMLIACILAILGVVREEKYELPIIGSIKLIK